MLRGFGAYFSSPWAYPQQTAVRDSRSPCLSLCQPALFLGKRSIPWLWRCAFCAVSVFDSGRSLWAVPMQPPGRPFPYGVCVHAPFAPEASAVLGFYADFGSVGFALRNVFPLPNSRWIWNRALQTFGSWGHPVGCRWTENPCVPVFLRGPSLSGASAPLSSVSAFARRNSAPRVSEKSRSMEKEFPSRFLFGFSGSSAASLPALRQRRRSFRYACVVQLWVSPGFLDVCFKRFLRASAPALPPIPASPEEFRFQGFLLIGRAASLALLLGLPPAVFSPSDDFFELPLSRSLMQPLCCIRIKHTLSRLLRGQFPEAVGTLPLAISAFSPFAIGSAPFPFS